ncbi:MAG: restriction endonuclease subunit S [Bacteroidales bacterium]|jgi:type I restriction enzyme S subunit|nr:restriction endonuclease subunit S [Bacteroidales bacterium]
MQRNYKRLGDYIREVDVRNNGLKITNLLGLTINKNFIPSVANTIGTDMEKYKVIRKNQFACSTMQVRRDGKMPVALLKDFDEAIISQAYPVFEVINEELLLPDYLMMWFSRSEFDREACFHAVGGVRGSLEWDDFLNFQLPVPTIEKQCEIVAEYNVVQNRINLNKQFIQKLEETAQAIYKHWFVDFEFPDENGEPYKSFGGKMEKSELGDIPKGWKVETIGEITEIKAGGDKPAIYSVIKTQKCSIPIYSNGIVNKGLYGYTNNANYPAGSITISARGTIGYSELRSESFDAIVRLLVVMPKSQCQSIYLWQNIRTMEFDDSGSVQNQLTVPQISGLLILLPSLDILNVYDSIIKIIFNRIKFHENINEKLDELQTVLLSKLAMLYN